MTNEEIRALVTSHLDAWTREDVPALVARYDEGCEVVSPMFRTVRGKAAVEASLRDLFKGLNQWQMTIDEILVDRDKDRAAVAMTVQAVQSGEMFGFPASGRRFEVNVVHIFHLADGRITYEKRLYDFSGLLMQLGILKAKTA
jgi:steroid delta-isomerase-like uncharacterized protein